MNEQRKGFAEGERVWVFARKLPGLVAQPRDSWLPAEILEVDEDGAVMLHIPWYESAERFDPDGCDEEWWSAKVRVPASGLRLISRSRDAPSRGEAANDEEG